MNILSCDVRIKATAELESCILQLATLVGTDVSAILFSSTWCVASTCRRIFVTLSCETRTPRRQADQPFL